MAADRAMAVATFTAHHPVVTLLDLGLPPRPNEPDEGLAVLSDLLASDPLAKQWFDKLHVTAENGLNLPVAEYQLIGPRLLQVSRTVLGRVTLLAGMYRLTGDQRFADRARAEASHRHQAMHAVRCPEPFLRGGHGDDRVEEHAGAVEHIRELAMVHLGKVALERRRLDAVDRQDGHQDRLLSQGITIGAEQVPSYAFHPLGNLTRRAAQFL